MPVKNVKRKTNDGFEGVITGLNDKEKEIIANSVGIEANPVDEATDTLTKLKVGDTTYDFNRILIKNGTYVSEEGFATLNSFSFTDEEMEKINNGEIDMLIGEFNKRNETYYYNAKKYYLGDDDDMPLFICSSYTLMNGESIHYNEVQIYPSLSQGGMISTDSPFIPELPSDASTKKYTLKAVNGALTWVDLATDTETFNNVVVNSNVTAQGNISAIGKISTVGGLEVYGNSVFTKDLSTSATLKGAHVVSGDTELLPVTPNPTGEATETLTKLKVGGTTYGIGSDEIVESLDVNTTLTIPTAYFQLGVANDGKAIFMTNENAVDLVSGIGTLPISELLKYDEFSVKLNLNGNLMKAVFRKKYEVISNGNAVTSNYNINLTFLNGSLFNVEMELQFWKTSNTFNANYSWCKVHIIDKL